MLPDIHALHAAYMTQISLNILHAAACPRYLSVPFMLLQVSDILLYPACCCITQVYLNALHAAS